jgi:hypothetical protein
MIVNSALNWKFEMTVIFRNPILLSANLVSPPPTLLDIASKFPAHEFLTPEPLPATVVPAVPSVVLFFPDSISGASPAGLAESGDPYVCEGPERSVCGRAPGTRPYIRVWNAFQGLLDVGFTLLTRTDHFYSMCGSRQ